jgi:hypothetical protein
MLKEYRLRRGKDLGGDQRGPDPSRQEARPEREAGRLGSAVKHRYPGGGDDAEGGSISLDEISWQLTQRRRDETFAITFMEASMIHPTDHERYVPFGFKQHWLAIREQSAVAVADAIGLPEVRPAAWSDGISLVNAGPGDCQSRTSDAPRAMSTLDGRIGDFPPEPCSRVLCTDG